MLRIKLFEIHPMNKSFERRMIHQFQMNNATERMELAHNNRRH